MEKTCLLFKGTHAHPFPLQQVMKPVDHSSQLLLFRLSGSCHPLAQGPMRGTFQQFPASACSLTIMLIVEVTFLEHTS